MNSIQIRPYRINDAPALYEAAKESHLDVYQWLPWCHPEYEIKETETWLIEQVQKQQQKTAFEFVILDDSKSYLGGCGLKEINWQQKTANLDYWIRSSAMGQGITAEAVKLLAKWGFKHTDLMHLEIKCAIKNVRSQRVAEKAGAEKIGIRKSCLEMHGKQYDAIVFVIKRNTLAEQALH